MRAALALLAAVTALALPLAAGAAPSSGTTIRVAYWESGARTAPDEVWTLRCDPARGTLAKPAVACRRLAAGGAKLFAPVPKGMACTEIYGGPQMARVVGVVDGRRVWATLTRSDGCQIERWSRFVPWLLPPGGSTG